jgi:hypothetical protein
MGAGVGGLINRGPQGPFSVPKEECMPKYSSFVRHQAAHRWQPIPDDREAVRYAAWLEKNNVLPMDELPIPVREAIEEELDIQW